MDLSRLNLSDDAVDAIYSLMLKVEMIDKKRIRAAKDFESLIELLSHAIESDDEQIQNALAKLVSQLNDEQVAVFNTLGVSLVIDHSDSKSKASTVAAKSTRVYRGQVIEESQAEDSQRHTDESKKGKKRVVYRGQETWVR